MKHFRYYILPRLLLVLSIIAALFCLFFLWLSLDAPLPSPAAICARIDRENYSSGGEIVASGPIDMTEEGIIIKSDYTDRDCWWFIRRSGDRFQLQVLERMAGFLWRPLDRAANGLSYQLSLQDQPMGCTFDVFQLTSMDGPPGLDAYKVIPILLCADPAVVRVEAQLVALSEEDWADPQAAIAQRGVSPTFTKAGDGVWVGPSPYVLIPWASPKNGGHFVAFCQGYDAAGNLVCSYDPTEDRE
ncbi:MAG: hypothetical protein MSB10_11330 [Clostridiales bacterium]|uniref:hypothetical protein n=1 Tax=Flavonifractor porci TaxID=3133422 RepID=UPI0030AFF7D7|nr:hypothetical protein [Clostridiales bacterium]